MTARPPSKPDDPAQYQPFRDLAAELEADGDDRDLDQAVKKLARHPRNPPKKPTKKRT